MEKKLQIINNKKIEIFFLYIKTNEKKNLKPNNPSRTHTHTHLKILNQSY